MKKKNKGFMLAETLLVTTFVAGLLIYLYIQFTNLNNNYSDSFTYNTVEDVYALSDVVDLIYSDETALNTIDEMVNQEKYIDISNCSLFTNQAKCKKLFELENINEIFITTNAVPKKYISDYSIGLIKFINKINPSGIEMYRLVASFKDNTYATLRFGD